MTSIFSRSLPSFNVKMSWTAEENVLIIEAYFKQNSVHLAQLQFKKQFGKSIFPTHSVIYNRVRRFRAYGTVHCLKRKDPGRETHSGRPKTAASKSASSAVELIWSTLCNGWNAIRFVSSNLTFCRYLKQGLDLMLTNLCDDWSINNDRYKPVCNDRLFWATLYNIHNT